MQNKRIVGPFENEMQQLQWQREVLNEEMSEMEEERKRRSFWRWED